MKRYLVFITDKYNRDNQAFTQQSLSHIDDDIGWNDASGDLLVIDRYADNIDEIRQTICTAYPNADPAIFRILECGHTRELRFVSHKMLKFIENED